MINKTWSTFGKYLKHWQPWAKVVTRDATFVTTDTKMGQNDCFRHFCQQSIFPYDEESCFTVIT